MTVIVAVYVTVQYMLIVGRISMSSNANVFFQGVMGGIFCIDFSLVCLHFFQKWCNITNRFLQFLGDAAYGVYLIHFIFTVTFTAAFVEAYNAIYNQEVIRFIFSTVSWSQLNGPANGAIQLFGGFVITTIVVQVVVWPLAYGLKQIPGVKECI